MLKRLYDHIYQTKLARCGSNVTLRSKVLYSLKEGATCLNDSYQMIVNCFLMLNLLDICNMSKAAYDKCTE